MTLNKNNISNFSIVSSWESNPKPYAPEIAEFYAKWLQNKIKDMTGYIPVISNTTGFAQIVISISTNNGPAGRMFFDGDNFVICGGRPFAVAGALCEFAELLESGFEFTQNYKFEKEFKAAKIIDGLYPEIPNELPSQNAHRPVPTTFGIGKDGHYGADGLAYYPMPESAEEKISKLTGGKVIMTADELFACPMTDEGMEVYGNWHFVDVKDADFKRAVYVNTTKTPDIDWKMNIRFYPDVEKFGKLFEDGDVMLAKICVKLISGGDIASGTGKVNFGFGKYWQSKRQGRAYSISTLPSDEWLEFFLPIQTTHDYIADKFVFDICPSLCVQEVLLGGFELVNYGKAYTMEDMPSTTTVYKGAVEDAQWRKDALEKIQRIRRGDINVLVKDADGNPVRDANVKLNMYEHELDIGLNISHYYLMTSISGPKAFRETVVENFNSYGTGHMHRKTADENMQLEYDVCESSYLWARLNGCSQQLKGHALMWDTDKSSKIPADDGEYLSPIDYYYEQYITKNDWEGLDRDVERHMKYLGERFPYMTQWDVSNEDSSRNAGSRDWSVLKKAYIPYLEEKYGQEYAKEHEYDYLINWYKYARKYFPNADLVINDIFDAKLLKFDNIQVPFLDWADKHLDFDAIGYQGHEGYNTDPEQVIELLNKLAKYGRPIHITEYDTNSTGGLSIHSGTPETEAAENYQANLVRDTLIAYFACENVESLYLWWHLDIRPSGRVLYKIDNTLKKSGMMLQDLFYNKWWTNAAGVTDSTGKYTEKGFFGAYTITVEKDGRCASVDAWCKKGQDNTIEITLA